MDVCVDRLANWPCNVQPTTHRGIPPNTPSNTAQRTASICRMKTDMPALYRALLKASTSKKTGRPDTATTTETTKSTTTGRSGRSSPLMEQPPAPTISFGSTDLLVSMLEVEHWMWPLFDVARWGLWRLSQLRVGVRPYVDPTTGEPFATGVDCVDPRTGEQDRVARCQSGIAPLLVYGVSPLLWDDTESRLTTSPLVHMTGEWCYDEAAVLSSGLEDFLQSHRRHSVQCTSTPAVVAVTFGSMGKLGFLGDTHRHDAGDGPNADGDLQDFVSALSRALCEVGAVGVLVTSGCKALEAAYLTLLSTQRVKVNTAGDEPNSGHEPDTGHGIDPVSYTHLTLPTIYSV